MKFGLRLPTYVFDGETATLDDLVAYARKAEALRFDSLWVVDHYLVADPSYRVAFLDPLLVLAGVAASTRTLRLGTSIIQLPQRNPVLLAREVATLDWLCGGRFDLGIGAGWHPREFAALGVPLAERGRRLDEYVEVMIRLWTEADATYRGRFVSFEGLNVLPKPVQRPHPPLSFGGGSTVRPVYADDRAFQHRPPNLERVLRRIGRYGRGWQAPSTSDPALLERDWEAIAGYARAYGRDPAEIERMQTTYLTIGEDPDEIRRLYGRIVGKDFDAFVARSSFLFGRPEAIVAELRRRAALGIDRMILTPLRVDLDELDRWSEQLLAPLRG